MFYAYESCWHTFALFAICESWRDGQFPLLPCTHALKTLVPTLDHLTDPQRKPHRVFVSMMAAANYKTYALVLKARDMHTLWEIQA